MIKKEVEFIDIEVNADGSIEEIIKSEMVRFSHTLASVKLYEQNTGQKFFDEYAKATVRFTSYLSNLNMTNLDNLSEEQQIQLLPILSDSVINTFLMNLVPCMYTEIHDGRFVQNMDTVENAEGSIWLMDLINITFFSEIMEELSANRSDRKKALKKKVTPKK